MTQKRRNDDERDPDPGIIHDEYTDDALDDVPTLDALDVPAALMSDSVLADVADPGDGIEEIDTFDMSAPADTVDSGVRHRPNDDAEMGMGAEAHSAEEMEDAAIGRALPGRAGHTRDDEVHGEMLLDAPDQALEQ